VLCLTTAKKQAQFNTVVNQIDKVDRVGVELTTSQPSNTFLALLFFSYAVCCFSFLTAAAIID
jgi:hypothetical protein